MSAPDDADDEDCSESSPAEADEKKESDAKVATTSNEETLEDEEQG